MRRLMAIPLILILAPGCYTYYRAPGAVGRVVDAQTGAPVRGAQSRCPCLSRYLVDRRDNEYDQHRIRSLRRS
jgi:hypothetical protein